MQLVRNTHKGGDTVIRFACLLLVVLLPLPTQAKTKIKTKINPIDGAVMVYIPAGEFLMGSNERDDEKPLRKMHLDGFWIYKYEVTVAQYRKFCHVCFRKMPKAPGYGWMDDRPMVNVNWKDAKSYCHWAGVQIPNEAQWEKAARGTDGRKYPWGNKWDSSKCANSVGDNQLACTKSVGYYPNGVSPFGIHDMAGNVEEWCADWYDRTRFKMATARNTLVAKSSIPVYGPVVRGGSWDVSDKDFFLVTSRMSLFPDRRWHDLGFRCAQSDK